MGPARRGDVVIHFLSQVVDWFTTGSHWSGSQGVPLLLWGHVKIVLLSLAIALVVALPAGLWLGHTGRGAFAAINVTNIGRALPAIAVLVLASQALGIGGPPALITLILLSIPPVLTNSYTALRGVDRDIIDAARGMGMTPLQILVRVEVPSAIPLIFAGVRTAAVQAVATATLAGFVAYDCLGTLINQGISNDDHVTVFAGSLLVVALALLTEYGLGALQRVVTPQGLRLEARSHRRHRHGGPGPATDDDDRAAAAGPFLTAEAETALTR